MKSQCRNLGWFPSADTSYIGYLQQAQLADSIRFEIRKNTKAIIASDREIAQCHFRILEGINRDVQEGIVTLSLDIQSLRNAVTEGFQELGAIFEWGFSEVLLSLGRISDQLSDLIRIAKTPAQTWAFEQFEIARDEFRRGLFEEALESVQRAIGGHGSNTGYKTEFRFYSLLGLIRLGNHKNNSPEIVDPASAEDAFLSAGRYAKHDYPKEAARAYCYGGRAAYVQKHLHNARDHTAQALAYDDKFAEAHFQMAQVLCALNEPQQGMTHLRMLGHVG